MWGRNPPRRPVPTVGSWRLRRDGNLRWRHTFILCASRTASFCQREPSCEDHGFSDSEYSLIIDVLEASRRRLGFLLCGYFVTPNQGHALIWP